MKFGGVGGQDVVCQLATLKSKILPSVRSRIVLLHNPLVRPARRSKPEHGDSGVPGLRSGTVGSEIIPSVRRWAVLLNNPPFRQARRSKPGPPWVEHNYTTTIQQPYNNYTTTDTTTIQQLQFPWFSQCASIIPIEFRRKSTFCLLCVPKSSRKLQLLYSCCIGCCIVVVWLLYSCCIVTRNNTPKGP